MNIIITAPSLDPNKNVSGVSSVTQFIIENNTEQNYIHFEQGRKDGEKGGVFRIKSVAKNLRDWKRFLKEYPDAIVHYNFPLEKPSILRDPPFMYAALKNGNRMVVHIHGGVFLTAPRIPFPFNKILRWVFSWDVPFITLSDSETKTLKEHFEANDVVTLPNCVNLKDAEVFHREYKEEKPLIIGYLGRIAETKGMTYLLAACRELKSQEVPFTLKIAGAEEVKGMYLPEFESLEDSFEYCGLVGGEAKCKFLRSLDVFIMPTYFEGLPMSLLECMSYGVVPVTTPVGSIPTVVTDGENGIFIKVKDSQSIVGAVKKLDKDRNLMKILSGNARKTIFTRFSPQKYVEKLNSIYKKEALNNT